MSAGSIVSIFGANLATQTAFAPDSANPPRTLGGVTVTIGGVASALFYVSPNQINARIDPSVAPGKQDVVVTSPAGTSSGSITVNASAPAVFSLKGTGTGDGAILNAVSFNLGPFSGSTSCPTPRAVLHYRGCSDASSF